MKSKSSDHLKDSERRARHAQRCRERKAAIAAGTYVDRRQYARGGRRLGVPNRITRDVRQMMADFAERKAPDFENWVERISAKDPFKAATLYLAALEYHVPKLQRTELRIAPVHIGDATIITDPLEAASAYERIMRGDAAIDAFRFESRPALPAPNTERSTE